MLHSWICTYQRQPRLLIQPKHQIHVLDRLARRAFHQIVDSCEHDKLPPTRRETNVAKVSRFYPVNIGRTINQSHKKRIAVEISKHRARLSRTHLNFRFTVNRSEDSP